MKQVQPFKHVAIIMDGNGRWAKARSHPRVWGHVRGSQNVSEIVEEADDLGIKALTLYAFSSENWSRPLVEVKTLFKLLKKFILRERQRIVDNRISFRVIGDISSLPEQTIELVQGLEKETKNFEGLKLTFAFGYGGRGEIVEACNQFIEQCPGQKLTEEDLKNYLMRPETSDVDLLIRTGGDQRVSNFLLWQIAYSELYFTPTKWPEFSRQEFRNILTTVASRERRFGSVEPCRSLDKSKEMGTEQKQVIEKAVLGNR